MRPETIEHYLMKLHEGQWFGFGGNEKTYANLIIHDSSKTKPTEQECIDGLAQLQADYDQAIIDRENNKASAKSKLAALGLTEAEIKDTFGL